MRFPFPEGASGSNRPTFHLFKPDADRRQVPFCCDQEVFRGWRSVGSLQLRNQNHIYRFSSRQSEFYSAPSDLDWRQKVPAARRVCTLFKNPSPLLGVSRTAPAHRAGEAAYMGGASPCPGLFSSLCHFSAAPSGTALPECGSGGAGRDRTPPPLPVPSPAARAVRPAHRERACRIRGSNLGRAEARRRYRPPGPPHWPASGNRGTALPCPSVQPPARRRRAGSCSLCAAAPRPPPHGGRAPSVCSTRTAPGRQCKSERPRPGGGAAVDWIIG